MVATAIQQLSLRPFAVSLRAPSAAQGRQATFVVRSQKSQNEAQRAAQQAVRCSLPISGKKASHAPCKRTLCCMSTEKSADQLGVQERTLMHMGARGSPTCYWQGRDSYIPRRYVLKELGVCQIQHEEF